MKIRKVKRAFSRMPRMFKPAMAQMIASTVTTITGPEMGKKEVALATALTAEMQAVRM